MFTHCARGPCRTCKEEETGTGRCMLQVALGERLYLCSGTVDLGPRRVGDPNSVLIAQLQQRMALQDAHDFPANEILDVHILHARALPTCPTCKEERWGREHVAGCAGGGALPCSGTVGLRGRDLNSVQRAQLQRRMVVRNC